MNILGINDGHNASVCLIRDGEIDLLVSEERFTRNKNQGGFPFKACEFIASNTEQAPYDGIFFAGKSAPKPSWYKKELLLQRYREQFDQTNFASRIVSSLFEYLKNTKSENQQCHNDERVRNLRSVNLKSELVKYVDHHECHALGAVYAGKTRTSAPKLVLTADGGGDGIAGTVSVYQNDSLTRIASIPSADSFAALYSRVTYYLGMIPGEHEYKVMGLAPYGNHKQATELSGQLLSKFECSGVVWRRKGLTRPTQQWGKYIENLFRFTRFDTVALAMQLFIEELTLTWIRNCIGVLGVRSLCLSGGLFMNVKLNQRILALSEVDDLFITPSCGDESNALGAAYAGCQHLGLSATEIPTLRTLYLGPKYENPDVNTLVRGHFEEAANITIRQHRDVNTEVAKRLAAGEIVARVAGREEFGARALGNRSLLTSPRFAENVRSLNAMIKQRDFWMPYAGSVNSTHEKLYFENPKHYDARFMMLTFALVNGWEGQYLASVHPFDRTMRPQVVTENDNPEYFDLLKKFSIYSTDPPHLLNTSFNLHGHPLVSTYEDACYVFKNSKLRVLVLDNWIISKDMDQNASHIPTH